MADDDLADLPPVAELADTDDETDSTGIDFAGDPVSDDELGEYLE